MKFPIRIKICDIVKIQIGYFELDIYVYQVEFDIYVYEIQLRMRKTIYWL